MLAPRRAAPMDPSVVPRAMPAIYGWPDRQELSVDLNQASTLVDTS